MFLQTSVDDNRKIVVGVCAMDKKAQSKPMRKILDGLRGSGDFEIVLFGDDAILNKPIQEWPTCDCLISFFSTGFPLNKAEAYVALRKPYVLNDLAMQRTLWNRHTVYEVLKTHGIPIPRHVVIDRDSGMEQSLDEHEDYIEVNGERFNKPFVEKPISGEDHNIVIYYPKSAGGGSQRLFRKVGDRSSEFRSNVNNVRQEGSYIYEDFLATEGTDLKVYTCGPNYAHAEARKSPTVDGKVQRDKDGKEVRYPVMLTPEEKDIARKVCLAFKQTVCGFDLLRTHGQSYVCDVNGWSFVKNSAKYIQDCVAVLRDTFILHCAPHRLQRRSRVLVSNPGDVTALDEIELLDGGTLAAADTEELRCVIAVVRHGDRTPKQKMKMKVTNPQFLELFGRFGSSRKELKLKTAPQLQELLDITRGLLADHSTAEDSDTEESRGRLLQMRAVLEKGGHFSGINRKVQLKPCRWATRKDDGDGETEVVTEALLILKWGGELTHAGLEQSESLGRWFRGNIYPGEGTGLLRLHSTYRHDLKIYSSDEGRVQMTAAAFAKGLLDLEGELTPINVSLVRKDAAAIKLLDDSSAAVPQLDRVKTTLKSILSSDRDIDDAAIAEAAPTKAASLEASLRKIANPHAALQRLSQLVETLTDQLRVRLSSESGVDVALCNGETLSLMFRRWDKLLRDFHNRKKGSFEISKIPDIYDCAKYDCLHNAELNFAGMTELYDVSKALADFVIPQEYGINVDDKVCIGVNICGELLWKMLNDLSIASDGLADDGHIRSHFPTETVHRLDVRYTSDIKSPLRHVRTRLYFTSESHMHSLLNCLRYGIPEANPNSDGLSRVAAATELDYLTQIVVRLYERPNLDANDPERFRAEVLFSPGACQSPTLGTDENGRLLARGGHVIPVEPPVVMKPSMPLKTFMNSAISLLDDCPPAPSTPARKSVP